MTFVSTAMAFASEGYRVRFADVDPETLLVTRETIEERITSRTRAVVVVHLYGQRIHMAEIRALCFKRYTKRLDAKHPHPLLVEEFLSIQATSDMPTDPDRDVF